VGGEGGSLAKVFLERKQGRASDVRTKWIIQRPVVVINASSYTPLW
jgi:hypothetical protein